MATTRPRAAAQVVRNPNVLEGEPTLAGTRVPVRAIAVAWRFYPDVKRICQAYPMLTPADVRAALAFYQANREEIDRYIAENEADAD